MTLGNTKDKMNGWPEMQRPFSPIPAVASKHRIWSQLHSTAALSGTSPVGSVGSWGISLEEAVGSWHSDVISRFSWCCFNKTIGEIKNIHSKYSHVSDYTILKGESEFGNPWIYFRERIYCRGLEGKGRRRRKKRERRGGRAGDGRGRNCHLWVCEAIWFSFPKLP